MPYMDAMGKIHYDFWMLFSMILRSKKGMLNLQCPDMKYIKFNDWSTYPP